MEGRVLRIIYLWQTQAFGLQVRKHLSDDTLGDAPHIAVERPGRNHSGFQKLLEIDPRSRRSIALPGTIRHGLYLPRPREFLHHALPGQIEQHLHAYKEGSRNVTKSQEKWNHGEVKEELLPASPPGSAPQSRVSRTCRTAWGSATDRAAPLPRAVGCHHPPALFERRPPAIARRKFTINAMAKM